jgi:hypothetical protein
MSRQRLIIIGTWRGDDRTLWLILQVNYWYAFLFNLSLNSKVIEFNCTSEIIFIKTDEILNRKLKQFKLNHKQCKRVVLFVCFTQTCSRPIRKYIIRKTSQVARGQFIWFEEHIMSEIQLANFLRPDSSEVTRYFFKGFLFYNFLFWSNFRSTIYFSFRFPQMLTL